MNSTVMIKEGTLLTEKRLSDIPDFDVYQSIIKQWGRVLPFASVLYLSHCVPAGRAVHGIGHKAAAKLVEKQGQVLFEKK